MGEILEFIGKILLFELTDFYQMKTLTFNELYKLFSSIFRRNCSRILKKNFLELLSVADLNFLFSNISKHQDMLLDILGK